MFKEVLRTQWIWSKGAVLGCGVVAFAIPILSVQGTLPPDGLANTTASFSPVSFLRTMEHWSPAYTLLAGVLGLMIGMLAWAADHRGRHVYALSLPIARWRFALLRYGSGSVLTLVPVVALGIGALLAVALTDIPHGLTPYPFALTIRFAFAALVAYSIFFAVSSGTSRTAAYVLVPIAAIVVADIVATAAGFSHVSIVDRTVRLLLDWPGVLDVFTGRWLLVDV